MPKEAPLDRPVTPPNWWEYLDPDQQAILRGEKRNTRVVTPSNWWELLIPEQQDILNGKDSPFRQDILEGEERPTRFVTIPEGLRHFLLRFHLPFHPPKLGIPKDRKN